ncbi:MULTISPECIES: hypothetical protein [Shewanella]|uniref:hypothetical protein n=1 Tax=Shewanella TaxID=22 RepID=UPI001BC1C82C|nr:MULTISPECIES: hypothetical protein [Shewanella]GIU47852.1 hypothetical protein TUM4249_01680 [Shewanella sp. KT0246]
MNKSAKVLVLVASVSFLSGCASSGAVNEDGSGNNRGLKTGAAGGAILGLAMGAAAGDASLALKGAAIGGAAGGLAGASADYANDREDYRNENGNKNININGLPQSKVSDAQTAVKSTPQSWDKLDHFSGEWQVNIWALNDEGNRVEASASANGALLKTTKTQLSVDNVQMNGEVQSLSGKVDLAFSPEDGYQIMTEFNGNENMRFVGEVDDQGRYSYYPVGVNGSTYSGNERSTMRLELRFVGKDVFLVDSFIQSKGEEVQIQSYRFTRQS